MTMKSGIVVLVCVVALIEVVVCSKEEKSLRRDLFRDYDADVRPVNRDKYPVNLTLDVALFQIIKVNEKDQTFQISAWLRQTWHDHQMKWDPAQYGGITQINVKPDKLWLPDTVLYNSVSEDNEVGGSLDQLNTRVVVRMDGRIQWAATGVFKTHCAIKVRYFPFDSQMCELKFLSWTYSKSRLDIKTKTSQVDLDKYERNSEWHLVRSAAFSKKVLYSCCPDPYQDTSFQIFIARRSLFYLLNLVFPISVITMLTILSFLLPAESGERISLAVTLLLAVTVFMLIVADTTPATSEEIPLVALYFIISTVDIVILIITICYVNRLHHKQKSDGPMGTWTRRFILEQLSFLVGIQPRPQNRCNGAATTHLMKEEDFNGVQYLGSNNDKPPNPPPVNPDLYRTEPNIAHNIYGEDTQVLAALLRSAIEPLSQKVDSLLKTVDDMEEDDLIKTEWRIVAMTVDRCLLMFFCLNFVLTLIGCFSLSPGYVS